LQLPEINERRKRIIFCKLSRITRVEKAVHPRLNKVTFAIVISDIGRMETPLRVTGMSLTEEVTTATGSTYC
jgi:hypothetical protein